MVISRSRSAQHKVYIPSSVRENHYSSITIELNKALLEQYSEYIDLSAPQPYIKLYQYLYQVFSDICEQSGLTNTQFIANDKHPIVRYSPEQLTIETKDQNIFLYNPAIHVGHSGLFKGDYITNSITLLFLPTGDYIRENAGKYLQQVISASKSFLSEIKVDNHIVTVSEHQHLSYDLFSVEKGREGTKGYKLGSLSLKYLEDDVSLPDPEQCDVHQITYLIADLPINASLRKLLKDKGEPDAVYQPLYQLIADTLVAKTQEFDTARAAVFAKGALILRQGKETSARFTDELAHVTVSPSFLSQGFVYEWDANKLVDKVQLVFPLLDDDKTLYGYGKYVNKIQKAVRAVADELGLDTRKEECLMHFHQHLDFALKDSI